MNGLSISDLCWRATQVISRSLDPNERSAVCGDLTESGASGAAALGEVLGLVARRQAALWRTWHPWIALLGIAGAAGFFLSEIFSQFDVDLFLQLRTYWHYGVHYQNGITAHQQIICLTCVALALLLWSWTSAFVLGALSGRAVWLTGILFYVVVLSSYESRLLISGAMKIYRSSAGDILVRSLLPLSLPKLAFLGAVVWGAKQGIRRPKLGLGPALWLAASGMILIVLVTWTSGWRETALEIWSGGQWHGTPWPMRLLPLAVVSWPIAYLLATGRSVLRRPGIATAVLCALMLLSSPWRVRAAADAMAPKADRKLAPDFTLRDTAGKPITLSAYKGKVVLLDFWATTCGGCKVEIPWYSEFYRKYRSQGLQVIGVAMDDEGMKIVRPFLAQTPIPYTIVATSADVTERYGVNAMPMTLLIDRDGRVAISHVGIVDKTSFESHVRELLK